MVDVITISWIIGGLATLLIIYAVYITFKASRRLEGKLKSSILLIVSALIALLLMGLLTGVMAAKNVAYEHISWLIIPSLSLLGAILFVFGARKLFNVLLGVSEGAKK